MTIEFLSREQLTIINRNNHQYPLQIAEKDYFLAIVSKIIYASKLKNKLVFKGGTALFHVYLPQARFSEDLDFTAYSKVTKQEVEQVFSSYNFLEIKDLDETQFTLRVRRLKYTGPISQASIKIDIDFTQNILLTPKAMDYKNVYGVITKVRVMDIKEIAAEKIRAMSERPRYRDFYDLAIINRYYHLDLKEIIEILRQKEIRTEISKANILANWEIANKEKTFNTGNIAYEIRLSDEEIQSLIVLMEFKNISSATN